MNILVAGGAGFIGSWIANQLYHDGHKVCVVDDLSGGDRNNLDDGVLFYQMDLRELEKVDAFLQIAKVDIIYYLAANAREGASFFQPVSVTSRNTMAYANTLMSAIKYGVKKIILFSSMAVYGEQQPPFTEDMPHFPVDIYGLQKVNMELMTFMLSRSHGIEYAIIRPHNVFGPHQCMSDIHRNVIAIWINKIMRGEPVTIYGDGAQERAFSYIEDSLSSYIAAMAPEITGEIFNIGGDMPIEIGNAAKIVIAAMGKKEDYAVEYLPDRHGEVRFAFTDHEKARNMLGLGATSSPQCFTDGVKRMVEWAKSIGPQEWKTTDALEIPNEKTPRMWVEGK